MITTEQFLLELQGGGVQLWLDGERLRCTAPKGIINRELQAELTRRKSEIIELLQTAKGTGRLSPPPVRRVPRNGSMPLSFGQQRLWFLHQMDPDSPVYNIPSNHTMDGPLNEVLLKRALDEMIRRHEILRTTFPAVDGRPVQLIAPPAESLFPIIDLRALPASSLLNEMEKRGNEELRRPFDLARGPLIRASLLQLPAGVYFLMITMHHIVTDGWSLALLHQELEAIYSAFVSGQPSPLPEPVLQYADYACWQREWLQDGVLEGLLSYWRKQLRGHLPVLEIPADHPRPPVQTFNGRLQGFSFPKSLHEGLKSLSAAEGTTFFMTVLAAFKVLLFRYTGQEDMLIGVSNGNRNQVELEKMFGFFVNTQVLRTDLSGDPTFRELLGRVRKVTLEAYEHQDLPFEKLVEVLQPARDLSHTPLFQVLFTIQNTPLEFYAREETSSPDRILIEQGASKFDLALYVIETGHGLDGNLEYNTDLFDDATITRMIQHFRRLLEAIVAQPAVRISDYPLLPDTEREQVLYQWNNTASDYPRDESLHNLIAAQACRTPAAVAVVFEDQRLTYDELNSRADRLAAHLRTLGVGPDMAVGVYLERSLEMVVGLLGVLKAGGAYLPLDPAFPPDRVAFMLADARSPVVLTQSHLVAGLPPHRATIVCLDGPVPEAPAVGVIAGLTPESAAYVIYTSGSTGLPKGVVIPHRAVVNFLISMRREPGLTAADVFFAVTTLSFDIAGLELWLPLMVGARLIIASREVATDGKRLGEGIIQGGVTVMQATPATWRMLVESGWTGVPSLKVLCGGEALPRDLADQLLARAGELWNLYGPTETTIWSTMQKIDPGPGAIRIGHPIANTQIYILDQKLQPVPIGVPGELCVGGEGVARGYLNRPELTVEKFVPDPFRTTEGARVYRTGDLARYLATGEIELLGRRDTQVKLRGFRIELGEIEVALNKLSSVREAAVIIREDAPGDKRLVAYVVSRQPQAPSVTELRDLLKQSLPDYMVPTGFVFLAALPLTPNGKVDRRALPAPENLRPAVEAAFVPPRNDLEQTIAQIWQGVLRLEKVGVNDNFFDLGGHSLLLAQVHSKLLTSLARDIPIVEMFRYPTVESLARFLSQRMETSVALDRITERAMKQKAMLQRPSPASVLQRS